MGTSIDCVIPKEQNLSAAQVSQKLHEVFESVEPELLYLSQQGQFTGNYKKGDWSVDLIPVRGNEPPYITGESGSFTIDVYAQTIFIGSMERFGQLYLAESTIALQLQKVLFTISKTFSVTEEVLLAVGDGDTAHIRDMAYYQAANFTQLCQKMTELHGAPAATFTELHDRLWYLKI